MVRRRRLTTEEIDLAAAEWARSVNGVTLPAVIHDGDVPRDSQGHPIPTISLEEAYATVKRNAAWQGLHRPMALRPMVDERDPEQELIGADEGEEVAFRRRIKNPPTRLLIDDLDH